MTEALSCVIPRPAFWAGRRSYASVELGRACTPHRSFAALRMTTQKQFRQIWRPSYRQAAAEKQPSFARRTAEGGCPTKNSAHSLLELLARYHHDWSGARHHWT